MIAQISENLIYEGEMLVRQQSMGQAMGWAQRNSKRRLKLSEQKLVRRGIPTLLTLTNKYI